MDDLQNVFQQNAIEGVWGIPEKSTEKKQYMPRKEKQALRQVLRKRHYCASRDAYNDYVATLIPELYNPKIIGGTLYFNGGSVYVSHDRTHKGLFFTATIS